MVSLLFYLIFVWFNFFLKEVMIAGCLSTGLKFYNTLTGSPLYNDATNHAGSTFIDWTITPYDPSTCNQINYTAYIDTYDNTSPTTSCCGFTAKV
jgi:hypothetical protein